MLSASSVHVHVRIHVSNLPPAPSRPGRSTVSGVNKPPWNMQQAFRAGEQKMIYVDANKKQRITKYKKRTTDNNNNNNRRSSYKNNNNKFNWFLNLASKPSPFPPCCSVLQRVSLSSSFQFFTFSFAVFYFEQQKEMRELKRKRWRR